MLALVNALELVAAVVLGLHQHDDKIPVAEIVLDIRPGLLHYGQEPLLGPGEISGGFGDRLLRGIRLGCSHRRRFGPPADPNAAGLVKVAEQRKHLVALAYRVQALAALVRRLGNLVDPQSSGQAGIYAFAVLFGLLDQFPLAVDQSGLGGERTFFHVLSEKLGQAERVQASVNYRPLFGLFRGLVLVAALWADQARSPPLAKNLARRVVDDLALHTDQIGPIAELSVQFVIGLESHVRLKEANELLGAGLQERVFGAPHIGRAVIVVPLQNLVAEHAVNRFLLLQFGDSSRLYLGGREPNVHWSHRSIDRGQRRAYGFR